MRNSAENAETFPQPSVATAVKVCVFVFETNSETGLPSAYFLPSIRISSVYPLSSLTLTPTVSLPSMSAPLVMLPVMTGGVCLGVVNDAGTLLPGEVRLFSAGGAEIVLKLDGTVVINGQVFEKKEE